MLSLREISLLNYPAHIFTVDNFIKTGQLKIPDWTGFFIIFPTILGSFFYFLGFPIKNLQLTYFF